MTRRKIVFVIVEGPSDETALGLLLQRLYQAETVYVHIVRGDITTGHRAGPENIIQRVGRLIQRYAQTNHLRKGDFREILHVSDMDGAFIDPPYPLFSRGDIYGQQAGDRGAEPAKEGEPAGSDPHREDLGRTL